MRIVDSVIIVLLVIVGYCYLLYPLIIRLLAKLFPKPSRSDASFRPRVSIVLAVYNEERVIERCIESLLALDYPREFLEIIIGSDGSSDRTNEIVKSYGDRYSFLHPFLFPERRGKMMVLNDLVSKASGEILYFVDADVTLSPNSILKQTQHFADPSVGAVAGAYSIQSLKEGALFETEKDYIFVEESIRTNESLFGSTIGLFGGNYSMRRIFWQPLPDGLVHDDLFSVLNILHRSKRIIFEPASVSIDVFERTMKEEFRRKSRFSSRGFHTLSFFPKLLLPSAGKTFFLLWSHKLFRWLTPLFLILVLLASLFGAVHYGGMLYEVILWGATVATACTLVGWFGEMTKIRIPIIRQISWLMIMSIAYAAGTIKFILKRDKAMWIPATRPASSTPSFSVKEGLAKK
ncbi:MAG: glycosyltransferase [Bacteroidota bacterium]|nr:glycosyltransferase [Bacteroidota bacterium]MDP4228910.1 glycosyltransferase [Bacteroidota bacterium]MDP4236102.1 glycosyltransferase [Bacteroidota bacterium]